MKRIVSLVLSFCLLVAISVQVFAKPSSQDFTDLQDLDASTKAKFDALISAGVFDGVSDGVFGIKEEMNRAQFAKVAALIFGLEMDAGLKTSSFTDVVATDPANGYALPYIEALKAAGITDGYGEGIFNPSGAVTKEQLATFLIRGLGLGDIAKGEPGSNDPTVSDWARGYVAMALEKKLLNNAQGGHFGGTDNAARDLLVLGAYETKREMEKEDLSTIVSEVMVDGYREIRVSFASPIDESSIRPSNIRINGHALNDELDGFILSEDGKVLTIQLHPGFEWGYGTDPTIEITGLRTLFGNDITSSVASEIVKVTNPPMPTPTPTPTPEPESTPEPVWTPSPTPTETTEPTPTVDPTSSPTISPELLPKVSIRGSIEVTSADIRFEVESLNTGTLYFVLMEGHVDAVLSAEDVKSTAISEQEQNQDNQSVKTPSNYGYLLQPLDPSTEYTFFIVGENEYGFSEVLMERVWTLSPGPTSAVN